MPALLPDLFIKRFDTYPPVKVVLQDASGAIDLTAAFSVRFLMKGKSTGALVVGLCVIDTPATLGAVTYHWGLTDTEIADTYEVEFEIAWQSGEKQTVPAQRALNPLLAVDADLNDSTAVVVSSDIAVLEEAPLNPMYAKYGAKGDGSADDVPFAGMIADLPASGGEWFLPGHFTLSGALDFAGKACTIRGMGGMSAGALPPSALLFTKTGSSGCIVNHDSIGFRMEKFGVFNTNAAYSGHMIDISGVASETALPSMEQMIVSCAGTAAMGLDLNNCVSGTFDQVYFLGGNTYLQGVRSALGLTDFSNSHTFTGCKFKGAHALAVSNPGYGWVFIGGTVQQMFDGSASFLNLSAPGWGGLVVQGVGCYDADGTGTYIFFNAAGGGAEISGNMFGAALNAVLFAVNTSAVAVENNNFQFCGNGVNITASKTLSGVRVNGNLDGTCTTGILRGAGVTLNHGSRLVSIKDNTDVTS